MGVTAVKVSIHQPEHLPWSSLLRKIASSDIFVVLNTVQFRKNYFQNRNRISDREGNVFWVTVPITMAGHTSTTIAQMKIAHDARWANLYLNRVRHCYSTSPHFGNFFPRLSELIRGDHELLVDLNFKILKWFLDSFGIATELRLSSELEISGEKSDLILSICRQLGATRYLTGSVGGEDYLDVSDFLRAGIEVDFLEASTPIYGSGVLVPGLSALDILMKVGPEGGALFSESAYLEKWSNMSDFSDARL